MKGMTIAQAIKKAKAEGLWGCTHDPSSVNVGFINADGKEDETQFDLYGEDKEKELEALWNDLAGEMNSTPNSILYVEDLGLIVD